MKISREQAKELVSDLYKEGSSTTKWEGFELNFELVQEELIDTTRWSHIYERVYKDLDSGKYYTTSYSTGATECQDESPYEYDGDEIELIEVEPYEVKVIKYREVK